MKETYVLSTPPVVDGAIWAFGITDDELRPYRESKTSKSGNEVFKEIMEERGRKGISTEPVYR